MAIPRFDDVNVGDEVPPLTLPALDRTTLALYAGASGDHNPIHIDIDAAHRAGLPDVIGHGMLSMAWLGRLVTGWAPQVALRSLQVRFSGIAHIGDVVTCTGRVVAKEESDGERRVRIDLQAVDQHGERKTAGVALVALV
jgi:acyl dehydratase